MNVLNDTINFIKTLSFVDVVFFLAVLVLMLLIITLIYFLYENKDSNEIEIKNIEPNQSDFKNEREVNDLKAITEALEKAEPNQISLNDYEEEQEEKAIISYEELLKHKNDFALNYSEEENIGDDLTVKKVDLDNLVNRDIHVKPNLNVAVISYEKEEAFLEALKTLQQKLN